SGWARVLGWGREGVFACLRCGGLTRPLTAAEAAAVGGEPVWGLVSETPMGTTLRRLPDGRLLVRNTVRYRPNLRGDAALYRRVRELHRRAFRARFPMLDAVEFEYTWGGVMGITFNGAQFFGALEPQLFVAA